MKFSKLLGATALSAAAAIGSSAQASTIVDLGFILDESGSVGQTNYESTVVALRNAISQIPLATANVTYRVGVVSFGASADTVAAPVVFDSAANKNSVLDALLDESVDNSIDGGSKEYGTPNGITFNTIYSTALNKINSDFQDAFTTLGDTSIINMATDGENNFSDGAATITARDQLITDGWDSLSFEAVANTSAAAEAALANLGFDTGGVGGCVQTTDASTLQNVVDNCFVIDVPTFDAFEDAVLKKVRRTIIDTGGGGPAPVPLPAGIPLVLTALGGFAFLRRKQKA